MGIRFYCPNGHKLNVKDFQKGLKGICPACGVGVQVPLQSTRRSSREEKRSQGEEPASPTAAARWRPVQSPVPDAQAASGDGAEESSPLWAAAADTDSYPSTLATFAATPAARSGAAGKPGDPLADANTATWFVRPPSGGQFGPATADVMRIWLAEGRVTADTLVWREGWRDWQQAGNVLSQLSPVTIPGLEEFFSEPVAASAHDHSTTHHDRPRSARAVAVGILVLMGLVISIAVLIVLLKP